MTSTIPTKFSNSPAFWGGLVLASVALHGLAFLTIRLLAGQTQGSVQNSPAAITFVEVESVPLPEKPSLDSPAKSSSPRRPVYPSLIDAPSKPPVKVPSSLKGVGTPSPRNPEHPTRQKPQPASVGKPASPIVAQSRIEPTPQPSPRVVATPKPTTNPTSKPGSTPKPPPPSAPKPSVPSPAPKPAVTPKLTPPSVPKPSVPSPAPKPAVTPKPPAVTVSKGPEQPPLPVRATPYPPPASPQPKPAASPFPNSPTPSPEPPKPVPLPVPSAKPEQVDSSGEAGVVATLDLGSLRSGERDIPDEIAEPKQNQRTLSAIGYPLPKGMSANSALTLEVLIEIDEKGKLAAVRQVAATDEAVSGESATTPEWNELAKQLLKDWEFEPARSGGMPVYSELWLRVTVQSRGMAGVE